MESDMESQQENVVRAAVPDKSSPSSGISMGDSRRVCPSCGRRFNPTSFERHQRVCQQVFRTVRPTFDPMKGSAIFSKVNQARVVPPKQNAHSGAATPVGGSQSPGYAGTPASGTESCRTVTRAATAGSLPISAGPASVGAPSTPLTAMRGVSDASKVSPRGRHVLGQRSPSGSATAPAAPAPVVVVATLTDEASSPSAPTAAAAPPQAVAHQPRTRSPGSLRLTGAASAVAAAAVAAAASCRDLFFSSGEKPSAPAATPGTPGASATAPTASERPATLQRSDSIEEQELRVKNMLHQQMQELQEMKRRHSRADELPARSAEADSEIPGSPMFDTQSDEVINTFLAGAAAGTPAAADAGSADGAGASTTEGSGDLAAGQDSSQCREVREGKPGRPDAATTTGPDNELPGTAPASAEAAAPAPSSAVCSAVDSDGIEGAAAHATAAALAQSPTPAKASTLPCSRTDGRESAAATGATQKVATPPLQEQAPAAASDDLESAAPCTSVQEPCDASPPLPLQARATTASSLIRSASDACDGASGGSSQLAFVGTSAAAGSRAPKNVPQEAEASQSGMTGLKVCEDCGRRFNPASFEKHRAVCRSVFGGKSNRTPFESSSQRLRSLPVRQSQTPPRPAAWELDARREAQLPGREGLRAFSPPKRASASEGPTRETSPARVEASGTDGSSGNIATAVPKSTAAVGPPANAVSRKTSTSKISRTASASLATTTSTGLPCAIIRTTSSSDLDDTSPASAGVAGVEGGSSSPGPGPARLTSPTRPLQTCPFCSRSFRPAAFEKHTKVCQSVFPNYDGRSEQRYVYDSRRHRLKGTPFEAYDRGIRKASVSPCDRAASSTPPQPPRVTFSSGPAPVQNPAHGRGSSRSPKTQLRRSVSEQAIPSRSNSVPAAARAEVYPAAVAVATTATNESRMEHRLQEDVEKMLADFQEHVDMNVASINLGTPLLEAEDRDGTAPADAAAGSAPRAGGDGPPGVGKNGMVGRVLSTKAAQVRTGETKREAAPEERKNASTSPRGQRDQGPRAVWQDRRGLLERARFGMKMSQRTEYASLLGSSVSQGSLREDVTNSKAVTRTPSVRTRRRHLAPPPKAGGNPGAGTRTASPGHEFLNLHEHDLVLNVDSLSLSEPIFDAPNQQEPVMLNLVSPMSPPYEGPVLQGRGDAGNGGPNADAARRRDTTAGSSGARRGRSTEDFRSYYERALEHLGSIGTAAVPSGSATADGLDASTGRNIGTEAAATCGVPVAVPSPMPRQGKRGIAREDLAVTEGKPGLAREDPAATEGKPGLAREDPAEESLSLPRGISGDLLPARQSMMPRTVIRAPPEVVVREAREVPGASRISRQKRDDTPQSRTPRGSAPSQATLAFHKLHHSQSPGHPGHSSKVPSPRRRGSDNPMLRRDASSTVRLRPGTASCGNLGSISATQASVSSSLIGSAQAAATRTTSAVVTSVGSTQQHLSHSASAGPAPITIVPPTSASPTAATILTSAKVQGADSVQSPNAGVPPPLLQSMPNSLSGSMLAPRNGIVPRLDFRKVGQPVDRPRGHSGVAPSAAVTPVLSSSQAGTVQQAAQMVSQSAAAQPVQKQTVPTRQSL